MSGQLSIDLPPMTGPQVQILTIDEQPERCWDIEGSPRSAKSWGVGFWIRKLAFKYPGIQVFYCRYKDDGLIQLRDVWGKIDVYFPESLRATWNPSEQAYDFPNGKHIGGVFTGSRVYLSSLKVGEAMTADAVHGKYKGKTIAVVIIEEAQEVPRVNYQGLKERLSQNKTPMGVVYRYPLKIVMVHNAVDMDHWITEEFPIDAIGDHCTRENHAHIRADLYSNAQNLGPDVMMGYEQDYPPGHVLRPAVIEGRRGVTLMGKPVYAGSFDRTVHLDPRLALDPYYPLLEGWDFGQEKPAVVWWQYITHLGALRVLGGVKGKELYLESFAPRVLDIRRRWFPTVTDVYCWADPTGATGNQGRKETAIKLLHDLGVPARWEPDSNDASVRYGAIQVIAGHMERTARDGSPAFVMNPRTLEISKDGASIVETPTNLLQAAFEFGYIWDDHAASDAHPNVRKPRKGTRFDDLMNAGEYVVLGEKIRKPMAQEMYAADKRVAAMAQRVAHAAVAGTMRAVGPTGETLAEVEARLVREVKLMRKDRDPADRRVRIGGRGGW